MKTNILSSAISLALLAVAGVPQLQAQPWSFGILSDTQWTSADDGQNPESTAAYIIQQVDKEFINKHVQLVVAVGDTVDTPTQASLETRSLFSQDLYNAGIAFYPLRGNHDSEMLGSGTNFAYLFPQIVNGGTNNLTPAAVTPFTIPSLFNSTDNGFNKVTGNSADDFQTQLTTSIIPATPAGSPFVTGTNFSFPSANNSLLGGSTLTSSGTAGGLSYSFDYNNVRFVLLDQFVDNDLGGNTSNAAAQQSWINQRLSDTARPLQAFVFAHKGLLTGNHKDNLFGANLSGDPGDGAAGTTAGNAKRAAMDAFITSLWTNNVRYYINGHDHHHKNSIIHSPLNSQYSVRQLIAQSDSSKFYTPAAPFSTNEVSISEDLYEVGYYIVTVDGPRVNIDYYAVPANTTSTFAKTPVLTGNWVKQQSYGYSLNGTEAVLASGSLYTTISDSTDLAISSTASLGETGFVGTRLAFLSGSNAGTSKTNDGRIMSKAIDTGWAPATASTVSDIVSLWGLTTLGSVQSDTIAISLKTDLSLTGGSYCLGCRDPKTGTWINAVDLNIVGGQKNFISGPWLSTYGLGTYGVDPATNTAWAVVNGNARDFAIIQTPTAPLPWDFDGNGSVNSADLTTLMKAIAVGSANSIYDLNGDGKVNSADARWLTMHYTNAGGK